MEIGFFLEETRATVLPLFQAVRSAFTTVFNSWFVVVANSILTSNGPLRSLLVFLVIGVGISIILFVIKFIRSIVWGG